jgi:hypothetical protein
MPNRIPTPGVSTPAVRKSPNATPSPKQVPLTRNQREGAALDNLMKSRVKKGVYDSGKGN